MKLSNKQRAEIKKKQDKNFKRFLEEANPMVVKTVSQPKSCPTFCKSGGIIAGILILTTILILV